MKKQATIIALLVGFIAVISINTTTYKVRDLETIEYSLDDKVREELQKGLSEYQKEYKKMKLQQENFYVNLSKCDGEITAMISYYLPCNNCPMARLMESTNRFIKVSNRLMLPVIFDVDINHSRFFSSKDGVRIRPAQKGYAITVDTNNEITFKGFVDRQID